MSFLCGNQLNGCKRLGLTILQTVGTADAHVGEAVLGDIARAVDITQIDDQGTCHFALETIKVERTKLFPMNVENRIGTLAPAAQA